MPPETTTYYGREQSDFTWRTRPGHAIALSVVFVVLGVLVALATA